MIDGLRPTTQQIWRSLSEDEQRRIMRAERFWEIHRHRMAPPIATRVARLRSEGRLTVRAGRIDEIRRRRAQLEVDVRTKRGVVTLRTDAVVNCTGPSVNVRTSTDALHRHLLRSGLARPGPHDLGFDATPDGALIDAEGRPASRVFAIGPLLKGVLWETTAVPEIRNQAAALAARLTGAHRHAMEVV
jgi:uncharacterized NAD(P)/FAD-binding protein YdhS